MIPDCIRIRDAPPISKGWMVGEVRGGGEGGRAARFWLNQDKIYLIPI